jgi:hypothetical protein
MYSIMKVTPQSSLTLYENNHIFHITIIEHATTKIPPLHFNKKDLLKNHTLLLIIAHFRNNYCSQE